MTLRAFRWSPQHAPFRDLLDSIALEGEVSQ
jgi:hypothetical protein